jgi:hypothetical protein
MDEYLENLFIDIKKMWEAFKPTLYDIPTSGTPINPLPWDTKPREETTKPTEVKGCYDIKGYWTYDRAACVSDQSPFYLKNLPDERVAPSSTHTEDIPSFAPMQMPTLDREEEEIQKRIEEKFIEPIVRTEKAQSLLSTIRDIVRRLDILSEYRQFSISVEQRMTVTREWLASIAADYSLREPSLDEMQRRADEIRLAMEDLETAMREGGTTVQASPEYAKTKASEMLQQISKILSQVPAAFDILTANDIAVPSEAIERYKAARSLYGKLEPECTYDLGKCPTLANVLDALDGMRTPLQDAVRAADDPGIAHDIEALFQ